MAGHLCAYPPDAISMLYRHWLIKAQTQLQYPFELAAEGPIKKKKLRWTKCPSLDHCDSGWPETPPSLRPEESFSTEIQLVGQTPNTVVHTDTSELDKHTWHLVFQRLLEAFLQPNSFLALIPSILFEEHAAGQTCQRHQKVQDRWKLNGTTSPQNPGQNESCREIKKFFSGWQGKDSS